MDSHLNVFNFGLGQQKLLVIVALPLLSLGLQLQHGFLGLGQSLPEVCDLKTRENIWLRRTLTESTDH